MVLLILKMLVLMSLLVYCVIFVFGNDKLFVSKFLLVRVYCYKWDKECIFCVFFLVWVE